MHDSQNLVCAPGNSDSGRFLNHNWDSTREFGTYHICSKPYLNDRTDVCSGVRGLNFGLILQQYQFFGYASSEGSHESAHMHMRRLA